MRRNSNIKKRRIAWNIGRKKSWPSVYLRSAICNAFAQEPGNSGGRRGGAICRWRGLASKDVDWRAAIAIAKEGMDGGVMAFEEYNY